jgi:RNA polymerase sigma-70 factor (ECF subfamily)
LDRSIPVSDSSQASEAAADEALLAAVKRGDEGAFERFVERWGERVMAFGQRMCGHRQDAEDVYQETLIKAFQGLDRLQEPKALRTWLYKVVASQCLMSRRGLARQREVPLVEVAEGGWQGVLIEDIPPCCDLPLEAAQRSELRRYLMDAVSELSPETRIVFLLRDVEGLSTSETAEVLGIGASAVKMRLHRARKQLRERLASTLGESAEPPT